MAASSPKRSRSSRSLPNWAKFVARLAFFAFALGFCDVAFAPAPVNAASQAYVDRRVTALPAAVLLSADPQTLIDRRRQEIAKTLGNYRRSLFIFWAFSQIVVFFFLWQSGNAARLRDLVRRRIRSPFWLRFVYGFALAALAGIAALPASAAQYRVSVVFDQSSEPFLRWLRESVMHVAIDALVIGLLVALIMTLADRMRIWWIFAIVGIFLASFISSLIAPFAIAPLFNRFHVMSAPEAAPYLALERAAGVTVPVLRFDASRQTQLPSTTVIGIGGTARIVLGDTLFSSATPGEVRFAVARQIAHIRRDDPVRTTFVWTFLFVLSGRRARRTCGVGHLSAVQHVLASDCYESRRLRADLDARPGLGGSRLRPRRRPALRHAVHARLGDPLFLAAAAARDAHRRRHGPSRPLSITRCAWARTPDMIEYHDREWGVPVHDDRKLFEFLVLEGAQAGLSWETILRKRAGYRAAFARFDPAKVARFGERQVTALRRNAAIVRNELKIRSTIGNARALLALQDEFDSFDAYLWRFVDGKPIVSARRRAAPPAETALSRKLSRDLQARGMRFVGPTIVYSFMQAVGIVNDHQRDCFRYRELL